MPEVTNNDWKCEIHRLKDLRRRGTLVVPCDKSSNLRRKSLTY